MDYLILNTSGEKPTISNGTNKKKTDIVPGQACINISDKIIYYVVNNKIIAIGDATSIIQTQQTLIGSSHTRKHALNSTSDHSSTIPQGHIIDTDDNGLPHDSTISSAVLLAALVVVGGVRTGRLTLVGGVPYNEVFTIGGVPDPLTSTWIFAGDPRCFNNIPAKVDPVITNITAAGFTAQTTRDSVMTYTAINLI